MIPVVELMRRKEELARQAEIMRQSRRGQEGENMEEMEEAIYHLIIQHFGAARGDRVFSSKRFNELTKINLIEMLQANGFAFDVSQFNKVMYIGRKVRDRRRASTPTDRLLANTRHAALNNFDYERLKEEIKGLKLEVGEEELEESCPILMGIMKEIEENKDSDYPGRRAPYDHLTGTSGWRFRRLCMLDEILYTVAERHNDKETLSNKEIIEEIEERIKTAARKGGEEHDYHEPITDATLMADFQILADLIQVEVTGRRNPRYSRKVYKFRNRSRRAYATIDNQKDNQKVSAFMVTLTVDELIAIERELAALWQRTGIRRPERSYPLLTALSRLDDLCQPENGDAVTNLGMSLNPLRRTDLATINYYSPRGVVLKRKIEKACQENVPVKIYIDGTVKLLYPVKITEIDREWALLAVEADTGRLRQFRRDMLEGNTEDPTFTQESLMERQWDSACVIGLGDLHEQFPRTVTLTMKYLLSGGPIYNAIDDHPLKGTPFGRPYTRVLSGKTVKLVDVTFDVYLNDDFYKMLYDFDRHGHLIEILPHEVSEQYEAKAMAFSEGRWLPYSERTGTKRIRNYRD